MFTKPEQRETVRFSNYSGLSFSLSRSSFGRAPPHGLPPAPSCCSSAVDLESHVGTQEKCHIQTLGWIHGLRFSPPAGAGSTGRRQQLPHPIPPHNNKSTWHSCETVSGTLECCSSISIHIFRELNPSVHCQEVKHQHRLPREMGDALSLESTKVRLGRVWSTLV